MRSLSLAAVAIFMAVPTSGGASDLVPADAWEVIHVAREFGEAEVRRDGMKDPQIEGALSPEDLSVPYSIGFYGCSLGRNCKSVLFSARLAVVGEDDRERRDLIDLAAAWNEGKLFGRAWLDNKGHMVLDHPLAMGDGLEKQALRATFIAWKRALRDYAEELDFEGK